MINGSTLDQLDRAHRVLIAGEGRLPMRLFCMASVFNEVPVEDFGGDLWLRKHWRSLRDQFVMLNLLGGDDAGRSWEGISDDEALLLANRFISFCSYITLALIEDNEAEND